MNPNRTVNLSIQVLPLTEDVFPLVDKAIAIIEQSGLRYEVGPMETTIEGPLDALMDVAKEAHLACMEAGAEHVVTIIKIADAREGTTIDEKVSKYREDLA